MTDQGWSNWWCERQRYGVVAVAAAAAIRGWRNQTESTHRRVAMSCWPRRRGKSCSGKDRRRNQEKYQDALLTVVGGRGECTVRTASTWRGARGGDWQRVSRPPCCTVTRRDCTCTNTRASLTPFDSRSSSAHSLYPLHLDNLRQRLRAGIFVGVTSTLAVTTFVVYCPR